MLEPYWRNDEHGLAIYHGDCLEVMPQLEQEFDLCLTDPPYGELGYEWDTAPDWSMLPLPSISKAAVFGHQPGMSDNVLPGLRERGLPFRWEIVWEKPIGRLWNHRRPIRRHELIWLFANSEDGIDLRAGFGGQHSSIIREVTYQAYLRRHPEATGHPTQKPLSLVWAILASISGTVLDPFLGSGTTLVAAYRLGRRGVGIEISEEYCELSAKRLEREISQGRLFSPAEVSQAQPVQLTMDEGAGK